MPLQTILASGLEIWCFLLMFVSSWLIIWYMHLLWWCAIFISNEWFCMTLTPLNLKRFIHLFLLWCAYDVIKIFATLVGFSRLVILATKISEAHYIAIRKTLFMWALKSGSRSCWCFMAVFFYIEIYPIVSSYLTALVCSIRSLRRRGRRRPRLPMRGGSNWLSSTSRLRRQPKRSWDLSWRFLPRSSTRSCAFASVLWNIWSIVLNSLVKVCDSHFTVNLNDIVS